MKRNILYKGTVGLLGLSMLMGMASCSDDHYDIRTDDSPAGVTAGRTIWQNIEANPDLSDFAEILKKIKVYRKEEDKSATLTYAELLNSPQSFTVWAPLNDTYDKEYYMSQLETVATLLNSSSDEDIIEGMKLEYMLGQQFPQNHIARFNFESAKESQNVRMMNSKLSIYDAVNRTFNGIPLYSENVQASSNGSLHILSQESPFAYNVYDYMQAHTDMFGIVYGKLSAAEVRTFSPEMSVEGALNDEGQMVYVDSVYYKTNRLISNSGAQIENEDSMYISAIPTDAAWEQAYEKVGRLHNYADSYRFNYTGTDGNFFSSVKSLVDESLPHQNYATYKDSIFDETVTNKLLASMYFAPYRFAPGVNRTDSATLVSKALNADSLIATNGTIFRKLDRRVPNQAGDMVHPLFGDVQEGDPIKASNGYIIPLKEYTMDPSYCYQTSQELDIFNSYYVSPSTSLDNTNYGQGITLVTGPNFDETIDTKELEYNRFRYFRAKTGKEMKVYIPLRGLYSGKYRIRIQLVPNRIYTSNKWWGDEDPETGERDEIAEQNIHFDASVIDDAGKTIGKKRTFFEVSDEAIEIVELFDEIEIPKCYANLPLSIDSWPHLLLSIPTLNKYRPSRTRIYGLSIGKVYVDPVHE